LPEEPDEAQREEHEAREQLIDAEIEARETLEEAEQLQPDHAEDEQRNDSDVE
jgi:hypothetical protein